MKSKPVLTLSARKSRLGSVIDAALQRATERMDREGVEWEAAARQEREEARGAADTAAEATRRIVDDAEMAWEASAADEALGRLMRETLDTRRGDGSGTQFRDDLVASTCPGTPERAYQDRLLDGVMLRIQGALPAILQQPIAPGRVRPRTFCGIDYSATERSTEVA